MRPTITNGCTAINQTNKLAEEQKSKNALYIKNAHHGQKCNP